MMSLKKIILLLAAVLASACGGVIAQSKEVAPLVPMLALNGKPTHAQLKDWLADYREAGIGQFIIYGRSGSELEYLSEDWFDACKFLIEEAERTGMKVWLYDDFDWPSGTAKKRVMRDKPQCALRWLDAKKNKDGNVEFKILENQTMPNLLNEEGVKYFIKLTHEEYYKRFAKHFGKTILGIFTDEPSIAYFSKTADKSSQKVPYYEGIEIDYKKTFNSDLRSDIAKEYSAKGSSWKQNIARLLEKRFSENYSGRLANWCAAHNIKLTGHLMREESPKHAIQNSGHPLGVLSKFQFPGLDEIGTSTVMRKGATYGVNKNIPHRALEYATYATAAYAIEKNGNKGGLAELFAMGPCDLPMGVFRRSIWQSALFGIDTYVLAISQLDFRVRISSDPYLSMFMSTYFNTFTPSQSWFFDLNLLADDSRRAKIFAHKERIYPVQVIYPYNPDVDFSGLLGAMSRNQISFALIKDGDTQSAEVVLLPNDDGTYNELRSGKKFANAEETIKWLATRSLQNISVFDNGKRVDDVFVREYKDGSFAILNYGSDRTLNVEAFGDKFTAYFPSFGVIYKDAASKESNVISKYHVGEKISLEDTVVKLEGTNTIRPIFEKSKTFNFVVSTPIKVRFSLRNYDGFPDLLLDGKPIECQNTEPVVLGFKGLYKRSGEILLEKGPHKLELKNDIHEYPYMPVVVIDGMFSFKDGIISPYRNNGKYIDGAMGRIVQTSKVQIPNSAKKIRADPDDAVCELFIDGQSLGTRAWRPFEWEIPAEYAGKNAELKLVRKLDCSRIFGKEMFFSDFAKKYKATISYRPLSTEKTLKAVCELEFIKE